MSNKYVIADTHFNHKMIIEYCSRPFKSVAEMDRTISENWNRTVAPEDHVIHIGDFGFGGAYYLTNMCRFLNGTKTLVTGNHDRGTTAMGDIGFDLVVDELVMVHRGKRILFVHNAKRIDTHMLRERKIDIVFCGHVHNTKFSLEGVPWFVASVERNNYKPVLLEVAFGSVQKGVM